MEQRAATLPEIWQAHTRIQPYIMRTPLRPAPALSAQTGADVWLKLESWQPTGSFKVRGAFNLLLQLSEPARQRGLVAASAGNHGAAVGYASRALDIENAHIFVPGATPRAKVNKMRRYGVNVHKVGETYDDAHHAAVEYERKHDATFVHAYDDVRTIAGAATTALEILEELPAADAVLIPVGGGGLISGMAVALKGLAPKVRVVAVQPDASPALRDSLRDGVCYEEFTSAPTICDGLAGGIGKTVFELARQELIDDIVVVKEASVRQATASYVRSEQMLVEGSGAVGLAALMENRDDWRGKRVVLVVSGANIDAARVAELIAESE